MAEKSRLLERKEEMEADVDDFINQEILVLPYMLNLPAIFEEASISQQHTILNQVFKEALTFREGTFRTHWIHSEFEHNLQKLRELELLIIEQPNTPIPVLSSSGEGGISIPLKPTSYSISYVELICYSPKYAPLILYRLIANLMR
jgi:site-specific DNA recombinase